MIVVEYPDNALKKKAKPVTVFDDVLKSVIDDMTVLMYASDGVGLAAPQVGVGEAYFVMDAGTLKTCVNPKITSASNDMVDSEEGCLSLPGVKGTTKRHKKIEVEYQSSSGELFRESLEGLEAIVFQHEFDHLQGKMFVDRMSSLKKKLLLKDYVKARG